MMDHAFFSIEDECAELRLHVRAIHFTQQSIAKDLNISQAQVSRVLAGKLKRRSRLLDEISVYVHSSMERNKKTGVLANTTLQDALAETWDGTASHAQALAVVIRAMAVLRPPTKHRQAIEASRSAR
jgi:hypothetical protein